MSSRPRTTNLLLGPATRVTCERLRAVTLYDLLLALHVIAAIVWLGAGLLITVLLTLARRDGEPEREAGYHRDVDQLAPILFIPASLATFVFGLLAALEGNWDLGQAWIIIGLAGWLASFGVGILYFKPESEKIAALQAEGGEGRAEASRRSARMTAVDRVQVSTLFLVVAAMVIKPTGEDVGLLLGGVVLLAISAAMALRSAGRAGEPSGQRVA